MGDVTVSSKYQIVIPKRIREEARIKPGDVLDVIYLNGSIVLARVPEVGDMFGVLPGIDTNVEREADRTC